MLPPGLGMKPAELGPEVPEIGIMVHMFSSFSPFGSPGANSYPESGGGAPEATEAIAYLMSVEDDRAKR